MNKVIFLLMQFVFCASFSYGQDSDFVIVSNYRIQDTIHLKPDYGTKDIVYIGVINDDQGEIAYHIISVSYYISGSGHSFLVLFYLDLYYHVVRRWELGIDSDAPYKISENKMYFKYTRNNKTEYYINDVGSTPPIILCVRPDDCY